MKSRLLIALLFFSVGPAHASPWVKTFDVSSLKQSGPGVPGESYISQGEAELPIGDCSKVMATWEELWIQPLQNGGFFEDHTAVCIGLGASAFFAYNFVTEPYEAADLARFKKLISELSSIEAYGMKFVFQRLEKLTDARTVTVHLPGEKKPRYSFSVEENRPSMIAHFKNLEKENTYFRKPEAQVFLDFLRETTPAMPFDEFLSHVTVEREVTSMHTPTFFFASGEVQKSSVAIGNFRQCFDSDFPCIP